MSELSKTEEIFLKEYQEAGQQCREHDNLIRTGLLIFASVQAAFISFIATRGNVNSIELVLLKGLGLWLSLIVYATTKRLSYRYSTYMERAKCIERELGMYLYQYSSEYFKIEKKNIPGEYFFNKWRCGNKDFWISIPFLTYILYLLLLISGICDILGFGFLFGKS